MRYSRRALSTVLEPEEALDSHEILLKTNVGIKIGYLVGATLTQLL